MSLHEVPALSGAVEFTRHDVRIDFRLALVERDIADLLMSAVL